MIVTYVVDRREGETLIVIRDDTEESVEVEAGALPPEARAEGAVLRVEVDKNGTPAWHAASRDRAEEKRRLTELAERVERLKKGDAGGDVTL
jgi:hypothetical protein